MRNSIPCTLLLFLLTAVRAPAGDSPTADYEKARGMTDQGKWAEAVPALVSICDEYPAHDPARMLLGQAYEKTGRIDEAVQTWNDVLAVTLSPDNKAEARREVSRLRRLLLDTAFAKDIWGKDPPDELYIAVPEPDWSKIIAPDGTPIAQDKKYITVPQLHNAPIPPMYYASAHFDIYSYNEHLSKLCAERCEIFLDFVRKILLEGEAWAVRFPIIVYTDHNDYASNGGIAGGVTFSSIEGRTTKMLMYSTEGVEDENGNVKEVFSKFKFDSVLQHEMLHVLVNEFMGGQERARWWDEGHANRFMRTDPQYEACANLARFVTGGEYFRFRDLFAQTEYPPDPSKNSLLYKQGQAIINYVNESGKETMRAFMSELRDGSGDDAAVAAALGIPKEGAVEELERRWVDWMRVVLVKHLNDPNLKEAKHAKESHAPIYTPNIDELDTVGLVDAWTDVPMTSLDGFLNVSGSKKDWSIAKGRLKCNVPEKEAPSTLGVRMNPVAPAVLTCTVKFLGDPDGDYAWFGIGQLDFEGDDTDVNVIAPMRDNETHKVTALWMDDLAVYLDDKCIGRYPSYPILRNSPDVDFPLALVAYGPVEVENIKVAAIKSISKKEVVVAATPEGQQPPAAGETPPPTDKPKRRRPSRPGN